MNMLEPRIGRADGSSWLEISGKGVSGHSLPRNCIIPLAMDDRALLLFSSSMVSGTDRYSQHLLTRPAYFPPETCRRDLSLVDSTSRCKGYAVSLAVLRNALTQLIHQQAFFVLISMISVVS